MNKIAITWINTIIQRKQPKVFINSVHVYGKDEKEIHFTSEHEYRLEATELKEFLIKKYNDTPGLKRNDQIFTYCIKPLIEINDYDLALERIARNANKHWTLESKTKTKDQVLEDKTKLKKTLYQLLEI